MVFLWQEYWSGLPFPPPVDHVLSELFTGTHPSSVGLHCVAHSLIELCKPLCHKMMNAAMKLRDTCSLEGKPWQVCESLSVTSDSLRLHGLYSPWNPPGQNNGMGSCSFHHGIFPTQGLNPVSCIAGGFFASWATREAKACVLVTQLYLTLWDPMDCSPPGSSVHGILQARMLEWVAVPFSRGSSWPRDLIWVFSIAGRFFTISGTEAAY